MRGSKEELGPYGGREKIMQLLAVLRQIATPWLAANWNIRGAWERSAPVIQPKRRDIAVSWTTTDGLSAHGQTA